jgi:hypothetical protein
MPPLLKKTCILKPNTNMISIMAMIDSISVEDFNCIISVLSGVLKIQFYSVLINMLVFMSSVRSVQRYDVFVKSSFPLIETIHELYPFAFLDSPL